jgi:hypothetical protein
MSVATALARARSRSISTISRTRARNAAAIAVAEPTAPTPMMPSFIRVLPPPSMSCGRLLCKKGILA